MYSIYEFLDENGDVIYVGKTADFKTRMYSHFRGKGGHLPKECYSSVKNIMHTSVRSKIDMDIIELYLINTLKPKYNSKDKHVQELSVEIKLPSAWVLTPLSDILQKTVSIITAEPDFKRIRSKLGDVLEENCITFAEIADLVGVKISTIESICYNERPSLYLPTIEKICYVLGISDISKVLEFN